jgi:hypothetical protein
MGDRKRTRLFAKAALRRFAFLWNSNCRATKRSCNVTVIASSSNPVRKRGLVALLRSMKPLDDQFREIEDSVLPPENVLAKG